MISFIQHHLRYFLIVVMILLGISFLFFGSVSPMNPAGLPEDKDFGEIDGSEVTAADFYKERNAVYVMFQLQNQNKVSETPEVARYLDRTAWQNLLLRYYANEVDIVVEDFEVAKALASILSVDGGDVNPAQANQFYQYLLAQFGIGQFAFEEIIRGQLLQDRVRQVVLSPVDVTPTQVTEVFNELYGPVTLQVAALEVPNLMKEVTLTPEEVQEEYTQQLGTNPAYQQAERRKVSYVLFPTSTGDESKLEGAELKAAQNAAAQKALDFALALEPDVEANPDAARPDFAAVAQQRDLTVGTTELFSEDEPAKPLPPSPALNQAAFRLTEASPTSGNVPYADGFAVLKLDEIQPAKPRAFQDVKSLAETTLRTRKAATLLQQKGEQAARDLQAAVANGKSFPAAAENLGMKVTSLADFVPGDPTYRQDPEKARLIQPAIALSPGEISAFYPAPAGGRIIFLESRNEPDMEKFGASQKRVAAQLTRSARGAALQEWFRVQEARKGYRAPAFFDAPADK